MNLPEVRAVSKNHSSGAEHGSETWIFSYADMITILMIFFILLLSISNVSVEKFSSLQASMKTSSDSKSQVQMKKSVELSPELKKLATDKSPTLAGIPLDAVAQKASEGGGDRLAQLTSGVRILLDSVSKEFVERDQHLASEFEMLKSDFQKLAKLSESRVEAKPNSPSLLITLPSHQAFADDDKATLALRRLTTSLIRQINTLEVRPAIRVETYSAQWSGRHWRTPSEARERTIRQGNKIADMLTELGVDPQLLSLAAYGLNKPLVDERTLRVEELTAAARNNDRIVVLLERRALQLEKNISGKGSGSE